LHEVERTAEELIVTNHQVAVLKIIPLRRRQSPDAVFSDIRSKARLREEVVLATTEGVWECV